MDRLDFTVMHAARENERSFRLDALRIGRLVALIVGLAIFSHQAAGESRSRDCERSPDCVLDAFKKGEIKPLSEVLAIARARVPGEVIKIELEHDDGNWVYEITILTPSGRRREVEIDARTLAVIKID